MSELPKYPVVGIDAGGTSIRVRVESAETGDVAVMLQGDAQADGGPEPAVALVRQALDQAGADLSAVRSCVAGITKTTRGNTKARWETALRELLPAAYVSVVPDYVVAFHGAVAGGVGLSVVAGTGSVVYGENGKGGETRVGGRGWEFGDEGSGTWLTAEAVRRTLRALDGLEEPTPLTQGVCDALANEEPATLGETARRRALEEGRGFLVPLLLAQARSGDEEARNLFVGAAGWLAAQARAAAARLALTDAENVPIAMVGGLWEAGELLRTPFETVLRRWVPGAQVQLPEASPVEGAARMAQRAVR